MYLTDSRRGRVTQLFEDTRPSWIEALVVHIAPKTFTREILDQLDLFIHDRVLCNVKQTKVWV